MLCRVLLSDADEKTGHRLILLVELVEHQPQLFAVLGHVVCLSTHQKVTALTDLIDILCDQLGHLSRAACSECFLVHILAGIYFSGEWRVGRGERFALRLRVGIDAEEDAIVGESDIGGCCLGVELDGVMLRGVGYGIGFLTDVRDTVINGRGG